MVKKLNTKGVINELEGSAYFSKKRAKSPTPQTKDIRVKKTKTKPRKQAIKLSSYRDSTPSTIENIRKSVKELGKEATFLRLTQEEKRELADIVYTYKRQAFRTSENEIVRIALRHLLEEHKENGKESTLNKVLEALKA